MTGAMIPYHLRPNKFIERQLFVELLLRINAVRPIRDYLYVGFGGAYLEDFKILHQEFGIRHMVSLEQEDWVHQRQLFNKPYGCIECLKKTSGEFIDEFNAIVSTFPDTSHVLIWLDYMEVKKLRTQLNEIRALVPKLQRYDLLKVTLNVNPETLGDRKCNPSMPIDELLEKRFKKLSERIGDLLPEDVTKDDMTAARYPRAILAILRKCILAASEELPEGFVQPLAAFVYRDSAHQMLTLTCALIDKAAETDFLSRSDLATFEFATLNWDKFQTIDVPYLSIKEKLHLDERLFSNPARTVEVRVDEDEAVSAAMIDQYGKLYRYYPHYHRIQY